MQRIDEVLQEDGVRRTDIRAVGELGGDALAAGGALVETMHEGIAGRPFGVLGPAAAPARVVHDGIATAVHAMVRAGLRGGSSRCAAARRPAARTASA